MLNHVTLLGRPAQDIELKTTQSGKSVVSFDLAVQSTSKDMPPDYIPVVCWNQKAEFAARWLSKGRQIVVEGRIATRKWQDKDGKTRKEVEVIATNLYFADSAREGNNQQPTYSQSAPAYDETDYEEVTDNDGDLPF